MTQVRAVTDVSDMGGRHEFFGPVVEEQDEPVFHAPWEARVFGVAFTTWGALGIPVESNRYAMNRLPADVYLSSYYRRWLGALELSLTELGYLSPGELDARIEGRRAATPGRRRAPRLKLAVMRRLMRKILRPRLPRVLAGKIVPLALGTMRPTRRSPRFAVGGRVRVREEPNPGHTRQPRYVSGRPGIVAAHLGATLFPDALAVGKREPPQHLYTIAFAGSDLFGEDAEPDVEILVDLYEGYLEPA